MMKILVVEDNEQKMNEICNSIQEIGITLNIEKKHSVASCITYLAKAQLDI